MKSKLLIIFDLRPLLSDKISGVEIFTQNLAKYLCQYCLPNWQIVFWVNAYHQYNFTHFLELGTCIQTYWPNKIFNITSSILRYPKIDQLILKQLNLPDQTKSILLVPDPRPSPVSKFCQKILTIHDLSPIHWSNCFNLKTKIFHKIIRLSQEIKESAQIITVSNYTKQDIAHHFGKTADNKTKIVYEGVEDDLIDEQIIAMSPIEKLPPKFLLSLSTLEPRKNVKSLIEAFKIARKTNPDLYLVLVGRENQTIFSSTELSYPPHIIRITRFITTAEKKWLYQNAQAFIFVSLFEGFGLPLLEAMSQACPIIYSNNSSLPEIANHGGLAVPACDILAISQAILTITTNNDLATSIGKQAKIDAQKFTWTKTINKIIKIINDHEKI